MEVEHWLRNRNEKTGMYSKENKPEGLFCQVAQQLHPRTCILTRLLHGNSQGTHKILQLVSRPEDQESTLLLYWLKSIRFKDEKINN